MLRNEHNFYFVLPILQRLNHHTEVFEQFLFLSLSAPATTAEIPQLLNILQEKLVCIMHNCIKELSKVLEIIVYRR